MSHKVEDIKPRYTRFPLNLLPFKKRKEVQRCVILWESSFVKLRKFWPPTFRSSSVFCNNVVLTYQYTPLTFIPKNIWQQFHKLSNVYFLCIAILQTIPKISATNGIPTILFPFVFLLSVNALKDAFEDWNRYKADTVENNQIVLRLVHPFSLLGSFSPDTSMILVDSPRSQDKISDIDHCPSEESLLIELVKSPSGFPINYLIPKRYHSKKYSRTDLYTNLTRGLMNQFLEQVIWGDVRVGDFLLLQNEERLPADIILLASSDTYGTVYVETASLDGETNWKPKQTVKDISGFVGCDLRQALQSIRTLRGSLTFSSVSPALDSFDGFLHLSSNDVDKIIPLNAGHLLLRGSKLCNTAWIIGIVVYTGVETKIMLGAPKTGSKTSHLETYINRIALCVFLIQLVLCLVAASGSYVYQFYKLYSLDRSVAYRVPIRFNNFTLWFFMWLLLLSNMVPISLIVMQNIVKTIQGMLISYDVDMFHPDTESFVVVRRSNLNDELGCITHLFSDKTGTLTCNNMEFRKCCIHGVFYGENHFGSHEDIEGLEQSHRSYTTPFPVRLGFLFNQRNQTTPQVTIVDPQLEKILRNPEEPEQKHLVDFFLHLAINNSVLVTHHEDQSMSYSAISSDEQALVYGAYHFGIQLVNRPDQTNLQLNVLDQEIYVEIPAFFEFTDSRKRTSCVVHLLPNASLGWLEDRYILFCKGADSLVLPRCSSTDEAVQTTTFQAVDNYARSGLRTICVAKRELSFEMFNVFLQDYKACVANSSGHKQEIFELASDLEQFMDLQGVVGIEDQIQEGVYETIRALTLAGIKIWMLTGDKLETAVNIGLSTGLLDHSTLQLTYQYSDITTPLKTSECSKRSSDVLNSTPHDAVTPKHQTAAETHLTPLQLELYDRLIADIELCKEINGNRDNNEPKTLSTIRRDEKESNRPDTAPVKLEPSPTTQVTAPKISLIIDGSCLNETLKPELRKIFLELCCLCSTVICSRSSPTQKSQVVELVKELDHSVTLAVGDGANDCNMIQAADVGVGIHGGEGLQAFNASDYGVMQFSFLKVLLLCHGRWCYRRISRLVFYMFYKNLVIVLPIFYFSLFSEFSGAKLYFDLVYQLFNILFTSVPVLLFGIFEQDVNKAEALEHPESYCKGSKYSYSSKQVLFYWLSSAVFHSLILFIFPMLFFSHNILPTTGEPLRTYIIGHTIYITVLITINLKLFLQSSLVTWLTWVPFAFSLYIWFVVMAAFSSSPRVSPSCLALLFQMLRLPLSTLKNLYDPTIPLSQVRPRNGTLPRNECPSLYNVPTSLPPIHLKRFNKRSNFS